MMTGREALRYGIPEWQIQAAQRPLNEAATLPAACYTSAEWYAREVKTIFRREWICIGRTDQAVDIGDYFTITLANEPIIVVRDRDQELRAYSNLCRHRGCLIATGSGNAKTLQCPYHRWTYALSGELLATPCRPHPTQELLHFRQEDYSYCATS